ncbi:MAG: efflux RND transporter periplasmic adaptor subunit, partial [Proteobacteria bacterium]|nr:efflux RND transporter periplasmic adaptor subunit [Pseudomonadota bacterium]
PVQIGSLAVTVSATGNLEPTNQVEVGSELSGTVRTVEVDYNDRVKVGQILARLDTAKLDAQIQQSRAGLDSARAKVEQAQATVQETSANLERLRRLKQLSHDQTPAPSDLDAAEAALARARAGASTAEAAVAQAAATLTSVETDLSKSVIRSPINGVVLTRSVEPGQTVAASLQAPVLFILAEDLTQMELHVAVDEADVGQVRQGQEATFTVDAYPERTFRARITGVHYGSQTTGGVVTYETVLEVANRDLSLRPGMTATAEITVHKVEGALLVPNTALRFRPQGPAVKTSRRLGLLSALLPRRPTRPPAEGMQGGSAGSGRHVVYVLRDGSPAPIPVTVGFTDGTSTQVTGDGLSAGIPVVVDTASASP